MNLQEQIQSVATAPQTNSVVIDDLERVYGPISHLGFIVLGTFALAFNYGAYMTEVFRAGIQAIPRGQLEAACRANTSSPCRPSGVRAGSRSAPIF